MMMMAVAIVMVVIMIEKNHPAPVTEYLNTCGVPSTTGPTPVPLRNALPSLHFRSVKD